MNPYPYGSSYTGYAGYPGYGYAGGFGTGFQGVAYPSGTGQGWWGASGYDPRAAGGWTGGEDGQWGGKAANGKASGKGGRKSVRCRFFSEGRCTRGENCLFSHAEKEDDVEESEMNEIQAAIAQAQVIKEQDAAMMARLEEEEEQAEVVVDGPPSPNDAGSDSGDPLPPPATEDEVKEAQAIVQRAQKEYSERESMREKAKTASKTDLQAMINARLSNAART